MGSRAFSIHSQPEIDRWQLNILLLSTGGGGGNILRSLKALFHRDLTVTQKADARYAERLHNAVTTRFLDTNEFSLADVPMEERLVIGTRTTGRLGARHSPDVAKQALEESRSEVEALVSRHSVIILIGTGGKGTGAGTMFPVSQIARQHKKLVIPIFVRPSFERHEVDKRRYDHALKVVEQFDTAKIRLMEILNDRGYTDSDPQSQPVVWERMNLPIARGLRGLIYVLWDLSQVDPSDLSTLFAGEGRLRMGFAEIDPPAGQEPSDGDIEQAVRRCWENPYYAFSKPTGTSLICIQGDWSNVVDAKIKGRLATAAMDSPESPYTPLYARAVQSPKPWGVTALFAEHTGSHTPLEVDWTFERGVFAAVSAHGMSEPTTVSEPQPVASSNETVAPPAVEPTRPEEPKPRSSFSSLWEFAIAVNRSDPAALALASNGSDGGIPIDRAELRKLLGTVWFRSVFLRLSTDWRDRLLQVLTEGVPLQNCVVKMGRHAVPLSEIEYPQLNDVATHTDLPDAVRADVQLLIAIGRLWGKDALQRCRFIGDGHAAPLSRFASLLQGIRG